MRSVARVLGCFCTFGGKDVSVAGVFADNALETPGVATDRCVRTVHEVFCAIMLRARDLRQRDSCADLERINVRRAHLMMKSKDRVARFMCVGNYEMSEI